MEPKKRPAEDDADRDAKRAAFDKQARDDEAHEGAVCNGSGNTPPTETVRDYFHRVIDCLETFGGADVTILDIAETRSGEPFFVKHSGLPAAEATHIYNAVLAACSASDASDDADGAAKRPADEPEEDAVCHATCAANLPTSVWLPTCAFARRKDPARVEELIAALHSHDLDTVGSIVQLGLPKLKDTLATQIPPITVVQIFNAAVKAVVITAHTVNDDHIDYEWAPLKAPGAHRAWAEASLTRWTPKELLDLAAEWKHGRLGDTGSIPHHLAADWLSTSNPEFDDLCALFADVCTAIAAYNAANPI